MWDYLFKCVGEDSELCGEQFFVECDSLEEAWAIAESNFPNEDLHYGGKFSIEEAHSRKMENAADRVCALYDAELEKTIDRAYDGWED